MLRIFLRSNKRNSANWREINDSNYFFSLELVVPKLREDCQPLQPQIIVDLIALCICAQLLCAFVHSFPVYLCTVSLCTCAQFLCVFMHSFFVNFPPLLCAFPSIQFLQFAPHFFRLRSKVHTRVDSAK